MSHEDPDPYSAESLDHAIAQGSQPHDHQTWIDRYDQPQQAGKHDKLGDEK
jgi:hypothetical protein